MIYISLFLLILGGCFHSSCARVEDIAENLLFQVEESLDNFVQDTTSETWDGARNSRQAPGGSCEPYNLSNTECDGNTLPVVFVVEGLSQMQLYLFIAPNISDVRMFPPACRRSLIWLLCNSALPGCVLGMDGPAVCVPDPDDIQRVATSCGLTNLTRDYSGVDNANTEEEVVRQKTSKSKEFQTACDESLWDSHSETGVRGDTFTECDNEAALIMAQVTPNPVRACLTSSYEPVECCPDPYTQDSYSGECVVACKQYSYLESAEKGVQYACFTIMWIDIILCVIGLVPMLAMYRSWSYPKYIPILIILTSLLCIFLLNLAAWGGAQDWVCSGFSDDYLTALLQMSQSPRCKIQTYLSNFAYLSYTFWNVVFALTLNMSIMRHCQQWQALGLPEEVNKKWEILSHLFVWGFSFILIMILVGLVESVKGDPLEDQLLLPLPGPAFCNALPPRIGHWVAYLPILASTLLIIILYIMLVVYVVRTDRRVFFIQWRFLAFSLFFIIENCVVFPFVYVAGSMEDEINAPIQDYAECVAFSPQVVPSDCRQERAPLFWFLILASILYTSIPGAYVSIIYLSHGSVWRWWQAKLTGRHYNPVTRSFSAKSAQPSVSASTSDELAPPQGVGTREERVSMYKGNL